MAAIDLSAQRVVLTKTGAPLKPGAVVKPQILLATLLQSLGFSSITIGTTAPGDQESLWYNKDNNTFRRYNPLTSTWAVMVPSQWVMHLLQMGMKAATVEGVVDSADKHMFFDVSANEIKTISDADYKASLGVTGWVQWGSTITLSSPANVVNFQDLPTSFTSVLITAQYTRQGGTGGTRRLGRVRGIYPGGTRCNLAHNGMPSDTFSNSDTIKQAWQFSGDLNDQTGFMFRDFYVKDGVSYSYPNRLAIPTTNKIKNIRYIVPDGEFDEATDDYNFAAGSVFKQFVR